MRAIKVYKSRRYTIAMLDVFGPIPEGRVERVKELARRVGVKPGTRIEFEKLPSSYTREADANRLTLKRARIRMQHFSYTTLAHELRHIAQGQQFEHRNDWMDEYGTFSSARAHFGSKAYRNNPYEVDARAHEPLGLEIGAWLPGRC